MSVELASLQLEKRPTAQPWMYFLAVWTVLAVASGYDFYYTLGARITAESFAAVAEAGNLSRRVALPALAAFSIYVMVLQKRERLAIDPLIGSLILLFLAWCVLSVTWAASSGFVIRRLVVLICLVVGALAFAARCSLQQIMLFALLSSLLTLALSFFAELALGTFMSGPQPNGEPYRFAGLIHPNQQGLNSGLLMIVAIFMHTSTHRHRKLLAVIVLTAATFLLLTKSRTSAICVIVALGFVWFLFSPVIKKLAAALALALTIPVLFFLFGDWFAENGEAVLTMGRHSSADPTTLTGRIPLWDHLFGYIDLRPIAGYGYDGFWIPSHVFEISNAHDWPIVQAHSGWITVILDLGYVGVTLFAMVIFCAIARSMSYYRRTRQGHYLFATAILIWLSVASLAESMFLVPDLPSFVCMSLLAHLGFVAQRQDEELDVVPYANGK